MIARSGVRRAHVLLVEVPGQWRTRATVERAVLARGWSLAVSAADADLLAVCGRPRPQLEEAIELVWHQMPGPRVRVDVPDGHQVETAIDEARARLLDTEHHRHDAHTRPAAADLLRDDDSTDHGDMDHGDMEMEMAPGGIALAQGGEDRDGLEMDVLNVRLGPVLSHWPAGLVLCCALQGDIIAGAQAELLDAEIQRHTGSATGAGRTLDNVASLLELAGWDDAAAEARRARDMVLDGAAATARLDRLRRKVTRSRLLRWSLCGIRPLGHEGLERHGLPIRLGGDTYTRLLDMLECAVDGHGPVVPALPVEKLPHLVVGLDVATARLVVASLDVHELQSDQVHEGVSGA